MKNFKKWSLLSIVLILAAMTILTKFSDPEQVFSILGRLGSFNIGVIVLYIIISLTVRNARWKLLLRAEGFDINFFKLLPIFLAGQAASLLTPGKSGDLLRVYGLKKNNKLPIRKTFGTIFVERFSDFLFMMIITLYGFTYFQPTSVLPVFAVAAMMIFIIAVLTSRRFARFVFKPIEIVLKRINRFKKARRVASDMYYSIRSISKKPELYFSFFFTMLIWYIEFSRTYYVVTLLGGNIDKLAVSFAYATSLVVSIATMLPGGVGGFEGSIFAILSTMGLSAPIISATVIMERIVGYGFTVAAGLISMKWVKVE